MAHNEFVIVSCKHHLVISVQQRSKQIYHFPHPFKLNGSCFQEPLQSIFTIAKPQLPIPQVKHISCTVEAPGCRCRKSRPYTTEHIFIRSALYPSPADFFRNFSKPKGNSTVAFNHRRDYPHFWLVSLEPGCGGGELVKLLILQLRATTDNDDEKINALR